MKMSFLKIIAATAATALGVLLSAEAQAAVINFSYDFDNGLGSVAGTVEGDVAADGFTVGNLSNLNASYTGLPGVTFNQFSNSPQPVFSIGTIEESALANLSVPRLLFAMTNSSGDEFQVNSVVQGQKAYLVSPNNPTTFVQDAQRFGTWNASVAPQPPTQDIPEPAGVLGMLAVVGCLAPTFSKRRSAESAA
jgi:hypothetical protein